MVSRRTNFGERSEPAPDRGGKLQLAGGGGATQSNVSPLDWRLQLPQLSREENTISGTAWRREMNPKLLQTRNRPPTVRSINI